jgi:hypothetical protein
MTLIEAVLTLLLLRFVWRLLARAVRLVRPGAPLDEASVR